jgi:hypothetical protein
VRSICTLQCTARSTCTPRSLAPAVLMQYMYCAQYMYSAASHAICPDAVLVLCDFHKFVKWPGTVDFKI